VNPTDRREFLRQVAGGALGAAGLPLLVTACAHSASEKVAPSNGAATSTSVDVSKLTADGMATLAPIPGPDGAPILVTRTGGKLLALSLHCTHEGCPVGSTPVNGILRCPCHGSQFDLAGNVVHGPADTPLGQYETSYDSAHHRLRVNFIPSQ